MEGEESPITGYIIKYKSYHSDNWEEVRITGKKSSFLLEHLRCGTKYQITIASFNKAGRADPSPIVTAATAGSGEKSSSLVEEEKKEKRVGSTLFSFFSSENIHLFQCFSSSLSSHFFPSNHYSLTFSVLLLIFCSERNFLLRKLVLILLFSYHFFIQFCSLEF